MFFDNKCNTFFGLNLTLVYTFPMCMAWHFHFPIRNYDFNRMESTNQTRLPAVARAHCDVFQAGLPWQGMAKLYKGSIFCHHGDTICHPKSGYVTTKLHGTSTCGCNNNAMFSGRAIFTFPTAVVCWPC